MNLSNLSFKREMCLNNPRFKIEVSFINLQFKREMCSNNPRFKRGMCSNNPRFKIEVIFSNPRFRKQVLRSSCTIHRSKPLLLNILIIGGDTIHILKPLPIILVLRIVYILKPWLTISQKSFCSVTKAFIYF